ncbi:uncharacterized protein LOC123302257 [Chrysoperla carnea]|uniref:uncharacterized protein LOC123302257 n=1 Tax=Chrysoperla carnea TaxID=189513 RepID=UPI001D099BAF|nr:uncharacterized protein LOC123302257 [Chrysoperla carnea]
MMSYPKKSLKRKTIIRLLRIAGHVNEYLKGNVKPVYQKKSEPDTNNEIKPKNQTGRSTWTAEEIEIVKNHFKNHIRQKQPPKKAECEELINKYPNLLKSKGWVRIKTYVYNAYRLKNKHIQVKF